MIYGHSQNTNLHNALDLIERWCPAYWIALDPNGQNAQRAAQATKLLIRRQWPYDFDSGRVRQDMDQGVTPQQAALRFVTSCTQQPWWPHCWGVTTPTAMAVPSSPPDLLQWSITFQTYCVNLLESYGRQAVVCNVPTGNSGFYVPDARYYCCQEYWWPGGQDHRLSYRQWFGDILAQRPDAQLFVTECGATALLAQPVPNAGMDAPHGADIGWRGGYGIQGMSADQFISDLRWYRDQLSNDPYVQGAFVFQAGAAYDWASFECLGTEVEAWLDSQNSPQEPTPTPTPTQEEQDMAAKFVLGFKDLANKLGHDVVGDPEIDERALKNPDGSDVMTIQLTTKGMMVWVNGGSCHFFPHRSA